MNGLFITSHEISWLGSDLLLTYQRRGELCSDLDLFLTQIKDQIPAEDRRVDLVIDQSLYHFQSLRLPLVSQRKIPQLLRFELENLLIPPPEVLHYPFQSHLNKAENLTQVSVFAWEPRLFQELRETLSTYQLEARKVFALENLLCAQIQPESPKLTYIRVDSQIARLLFFENSLLCAVSQVEAPQTRDSEGYAHWAQEINGIIATASVMGGHDEVLLDSSSQLFFRLSTQGFLEPKNSLEPVDIPAVANSALLEPTFLKSKQVLPLGAAQPALLNEFKKHRTKLKKTLILSGSFLLLWATATAVNLFQGYHLSNQLKRDYESSIAQYAPGLSPINGLEVIKEKLAPLRAQAGSQSKTPPYHYSRGFSQISAIVKKAPSLNLSRLSAKNTDWTLVGTTTSSQDFETTKKELKTLFPASKYSMTISQKAQGGGKVSFTVSVIFKGGA